jgi:hypothetical protein
MLYVSAQRRYFISADNVGKDIKSLLPVGIQDILMQALLAVVTDRTAIMQLLCALRSSLNVLSQTGGMFCAVHDGCQVTPSAAN